jgi:hypothetical protein
MSEQERRYDPATPDGGPIDGNPWPAQITGHVVDPGPPVRVRGYEVDGDLAVHYRYADLLGLALEGELPGDAAGRALDLALVLLAPVPVTCGPAHAGVLARTCGARSSAALAIAALALAEEARFTVAAHAPLLAWLDAPTGDLPAPWVATSAAERLESAGIAAAVRATGLDVPALASAPTRLAALLAILHAAGLRRPEQLETAMVIARLPCVMGEALAVSAGSFQKYPMRVPPFRHEVPR